MELVIVAALLAVAPQVGGGPQDEVRKALAVCAGVTEGAARLDCYDQMARAISQLPVEQPTSKVKTSVGPGRWQVNVAANPIDDSKIITAVTVGESDGAEFVLRCKQGKPEAYVSVAKYLGTDSTTVQSRIGDAKAESKRWAVSMNHKAAFYPGDVGLLIKKLQSVERFVVQIRPFDESPITAIFGTIGLSEVAASLGQGCRLP